MNYSEQFWEKQFARDEKPKKKPKKTEGETWSLVTPFWNQEVTPPKKIKNPSRVTDVQLATVKERKRKTSCEIEENCRVQRTELRKDVKTPKILSDLQEQGINFRTHPVMANSEQKKHYLELVEKISREEGVPSKSIISMILKENEYWDPLYKVNIKGQSAFWLGQHTYEIRQLYKNKLQPPYRYDNPEDQIRVTALYLKDMCKNYSCWWNWDLARALYHVWTWIFRVPEENIRGYLANNSWVRKKIPDGTSINGLTYFTGALAYYTNKSFKEASLIIDNSTAFKRRFWLA